MMAKRPDGKIKDNVSGEHTFGHNLLTLENVRRLADCATHWAIAMNFANDEMVPKHNFFRAEYMISLFEQGKLCRTTLIAGITTKREPPKPVPAPFFRTLDFLLQYVCGGNVYRPITDKDYSKGVPPAAWCRVPVVAATEDAAAATAAAVQHASAAELELIPPTHPIRLFFSSRCWCVVTAFHITASSVKVNVGMPADVMYDAYMDGKVSDYALVVGLTDAAPPGNLWVPPCVMLPLGALLYTHGAGRPYLPLSLNELRDVRGSGVLSLGARKDARPLPLPPGIQPREDPAAAAAAAEAEAALSRAAAEAEAEEARARSASSAAVPSGRASDGMVIGGRTTGRTNSQSASSALMAAAGGSGSGIGVQSSGGGPANGGTVAPPPLFPDPLLDSAKWIMPQPFDTPLPPPPQPPSADSSAAADGAGGSGGTASNSSPTLPATVAVPALAPSPYLGDLNNGVQTHFETPPMRLFMGERAQMALAANWWYIDSETGIVHGPYSPEQMVLSFCAGCRELAEETRVCGTDADVRPPLQPPPAAFLPLSHLMQQINDGAIYVLVSRADILSPLGHRFLATRTRQPPPLQPEAPQPMATAAAPSPPPIVVTVQQQPSQAQPSQPIVYQPHKPPGLVVAAAPSSGAPSALTLPQAVGTAAAAGQQLSHATLQPTQPQTQPKPQQPAAYQPPTAPTVVAAVPMPAAVPHVVRALPLASHPLQPRPMVAAAPAYIMPGALMCMPPYGSMAMAYGGQAVMAQPVLATAAAPPPQPPKPQQ